MTEAEDMKRAFKLKLERRHGLTGHPRADKLWELAWGYGHSAGLGEVEIYYQELAELLKP